MARLDELGDADGWRCWLCDEPVDPDMSVNDPRGPSADALVTASRAKGSKGAKGRTSVVGTERLAHRACNTKKGAIAAEVRWADGLFVVDPAPILTSVERLDRKGGREIMARCPTADDADDAATWLVDRLSRLTPGVPVHATVEPGGGQFLVVLSV